MNSHSIIDRVLAQRERDPQRLFCVSLTGGSSERISFDNLVNEAARFGNALSELGVIPNDRVIIILDFSPDCYYSFLGAMLIGAQPAFLSPLTTKQNPVLYYEALPRLMSRLDAAAIVTSALRLADIRRVVPELPLRILDVGQRDRFPPTMPTRRQDIETAFLQLSSGTTGLKKAVSFSHRAVLAQVDVYARRLFLRTNDIIASWLPLYHDMGLIACVILPMITGTPVISMDALQWVMRPAMFLRAIEEHRATLAWLPNFAFHHLAAHSGRTPYDLSSMRAIINCSEPCKAETFDLFIRRFGPMGIRREALQCCYAMAENVFAVSQSTVGRAARVDRVCRDAFAREHVARPCVAEGTAHQLFLSCGPPLTNARVRIVGDTGEDLPERHVGEILVSSDCLSGGYVNQPDVTGRTFRSGWFRTADLGYLADGELFVAGRKDDLIISNGRNYYAHEIERQVNQQEGVIPGRSVALGVYNSDSGSQDIIVLAESYHFGTTDAGAVADRIRAAIAEEFGVSLQATHICRRGELIKTSSGKISRSENMRRYLEQSVVQEV